MSMNQFFLALKDLWRRKINSLILLIQVVMVLILINLTIISFFDLKNITKEVNRLNKNENIFSLMDVTDRVQIDQLLSDESKLKDLRNVYNYIFNNENYKAFTLYSSSLNFQDNKMKDVKDLAHSEESTSVHFLYVNDIFLQYFNLEINAGSLFTPEDYTSDDKVIPIILGSNYQDIFHVGETFTDLYDNKYMVRGILGSGMNYIDIMSSRDFIDIDSMMLMPLNEKKMASNTDFDAVINKAYIIPEKELGMTEIIKYAATMDTYSFAYKSMKDQVNFVIMDKEKWIQTQLFLSSIVAIFTIISFIITFLQFIEKNTYEFGVHFLTGATNRDIMLRIIFQIAPFILIGNVISLLITGISLSWLITMTASLALLVLVCVIPVLKINRMEVNLILRWKNK